MKFVTDLLEKVRQSKVRDDEVIKAVEEMKRAGVKMLRDKEWREVDSIMYKKEKMYVPKNDKLRAEIIRLHHDMLVGIMTWQKWLSQYLFYFLFSFLLFSY